MPTTKPGQKILVTGANGYLAVWLVQDLLKKGYAVRGTVRNGKGAYLLQLFAQYVSKGLFEIVEVDDFTKEGAFDEAVKGVDAIQHVASPFHFNSEDPDDYIIPALKGTEYLLQAALKNGGSTLKRVVVVSTCLAVMERGLPPKVYDENDWNSQSVANVKKDGKGADAFDKYTASKILSEKAAWDFYKANKDKITWDLAVLLPPYIFGPMLHEVKSLATVNTSSQHFWNIAITGAYVPGDITKLGACYVDVRDFATALAVSLEKEEASGERIIVSARPFVWQDLADAAAAVLPSLKPALPAQYASLVPKGTPGAGKTAVHEVDYNPEKQKRLLGVKFRTIEETTKDFLEDITRRGW